MKFFNYISLNYFAETSKFEFKYGISSSSSSSSSIDNDNISSTDKRKASEQILKRCNYINNINYSNTLENSVICGVAPFVPESAISAYFEDVSVTNSADNVNLFNTMRFYIENKFFDENN